jgi:hypothetical protein
VESIEPYSGEDRRRKSDVKFDALVDQINSLTESVGRLINQDSKKSGNTTTVIHKTVGFGNWGVAALVAAIVACFATWAIIGILAMIFVPEIHDLRAWHDIDRKEIAQLKAQLQERAK